MQKIIINGALGKMGRALAEIVVAAPDIETVAGVDLFAAGASGSFPLYETLGDDVPTADVLVDFSRHDSIGQVLAFCLGRNMPVVVATTAHTPEELKLIEEAARKIPVFKAANMSLGVNVLIDLCKKAGAILRDFDIEIVEKHHNTKIDAPSGTALLIADSINEAHQQEMQYVFGRRETNHRRGARELGIHAVRGGTLVGEHEVLFIGGDETLTIGHQAQSRQIYAYGALRAVRYIAGRPPRLYNMQDLLLERSTVTSLRVDESQALITARGVRKVAGLFAAISDINVDMISQVAPSKDGVDISFSLPAEALREALEKVRPLAGELSTIARATKITVEGLGMERQTGVAARVFGLLEGEGILCHLITTSETAISVCIPPDKQGQAIRAIREAFLNE